MSLYSTVPNNPTTFYNIGNESWKVKSPILPIQ